MDQHRRNQYLQALGIPVYKQRPARDGVAGDAPKSTSIAVGSPPAQLPPAQPLSSQPPPAQLPPAQPLSSQPPPAQLPPAQPLSSQPDSAAAALGALREEVAGCTRCTLCQTRTQTVFGAGPVAADCMFIGEGPGAEEDRQGEPFVGRAGQLLNRMLAAIGLSRSQVYIANIVKCRPPRNRDPNATEVTACQDYLKRQVQLVAPRVIVTIGRVSAQNLLQSTASIKQLRDHQERHVALGVPVLVTYHPAYLLRNPIDKRKSWDDLKRLRTMLASSLDR